jgi:CBS domain-containing protein
MQIKDIMTRNVETAGIDTPIANIAERMRSYDIGALPICDGNRLVGMLSDRDITVRAMANNLHPEQLRCQDIMTPDVIFCFEDQDIDAARELMQRSRFVAYLSRCQDRFRNNSNRRFNIAVDVITDLRRI